MKSNDKRTDEQGRAYKGSQLQVQLYVNRREPELSAAAGEALGMASEAITWVSPLEGQSFEEYRDMDFLEAAGQRAAAVDLAEFWPEQGPVWDALATVRTSNGPTGVILAEGKSYPAEMCGSGCLAGPKSRKIIDASLGRTKSWLGVPDSSDWTGDYYQFANRLAHLFFFREVVGVPAWLVSLCFVDDPHKPTSLDKWQAGLLSAKANMGIGSRPLPYYADVFLPARSRSELE